MEVEPSSFSIPNSNSHILIPKFFETEILRRSYLYGL